MLVVVLEENGFGSRPCFKSCVAVAKETVGYALYYLGYSTFEGKWLYMEDMYVQKAYRQQGIGLSFFQYVAQVIQWQLHEGSHWS